MAVEKIILLKINVEGEVEVETAADVDTDGLAEIVEVIKENAQ